MPGLVPTCLDHAVLAVADLGAATAAYSILLGREPSWHGSHPALGTRNALFRLENTYLELIAAEKGAAGLLNALVREALGERQERPFALALGVTDLDEAVRAARARGLALTDAAPGSGRDHRSGMQRSWRSAVIEPRSVRGLRLFLIQHTSPAALLPPAAPAAEPGATCDAVDHAVIFSQDFEASRALWADVLGLRQAWLRDFAERHTRNTGLALGDIIVELIMRTDRPPRDKPDTFWGLAYRTAACERAVPRLRRAGFEVDDPRPGLEPGTRVATVRWQRTPTLLITRGVVRPPD
jgi:catechol 2,3-dioxygenase-like lactoylglutathione lyase family enzyme